MAGELERRLSLDMVQDMLRDWLAVNEQAAALYESMPPAQQEWAVTSGGGFEMLVPCLAVMKPEVREVARSFLLDGIEAIDWLSQGFANVPNERSGPSDGAEMNEKVDIDELRAEIRTLRDERDRLAAQLQDLRTTLRTVAAISTSAAGFDAGDQREAHRFGDGRIAS